MPPRTWCAAPVQPSRGGESSGSVPEEPTGPKGEHDRTGRERATAELDLDTLLNAPKRFFIDERTQELTTLYPDSLLSSKNIARKSSPTARRIKSKTTQNFKWTSENVIVDERGGWLRMRNPKTGQWGDYCEFWQDNDGYFRCAQMQSQQSKYAVLKQ